MVCKYGGLLPETKVNNVISNKGKKIAHTKNTNYNLTKIKFSYELK